MLFQANNDSLGGLPKYRKEIDRKDRISGIRENTASEISTSSSPRGFQPDSRYYRRLPSA
ncbi:hypothetical protein U6B65_13000 [Oscillospiraceae bacterium MB08-C2-2]|nr:hypothetical protein U6B65_13000 [Oscillospiraceae bacterium MB08-C2-2]